MPNDAAMQRTLAVHRMKSRDPQEDPCGTPYIKSDVADLEPLKETDWILFA